MSADELRQAAALMRERAEKSITGDLLLPGDHWHYDLAWNGSRDDYEVIATDEGSMIAEKVHGRWAAEHIASWHPTVALAVADWLDNCADRWPYSERHTPEQAHALAVARAYLGGAS